MELKQFHGTLIGGTFVKRGTQVVKFWKHGGYGLPQELLLKEEVKKIRLYTKYDGTLEATKDKFNIHGSLHKFKDEWQIILPTEHWENK